MPDTLAELALSPVYRHAQRSLAVWLDNEHGKGRQLAFRARRALAALGPTERPRLVRWLAWLSVAAQSHGLEDPGPRIGWLDNALHQLVTDAHARLPTLASSGEAVKQCPSVRGHRSTHDFRQHGAMTSGTSLEAAQAAV